jgi:hypothetical protein
MRVLIKCSMKRAPTSRFLTRDFVFSFLTFRTYLKSKLCHEHEEKVVVPRCVKQFLIARASRIGPNKFSKLVKNIKILRGTSLWFYYYQYFTWYCMWSCRPLRNESFKKNFWKISKNQVFVSSTRRFCEWYHQTNIPFYLFETRWPIEFLQLVPEGFASSTIEEIFILSLWGHDNWFWVWKEVLQVVPLKKYLFPLFEDTITYLECEKRSCK